MDLFTRFLREDKKIIWYIACSIFFLNLFLVSVPFLVQALISHFFNLGLNRPLYLICILLLVLLSCSYMLGAVREYFAELLKRRIFVRTFYNSFERVIDTDSDEFNAFQGSRFLEVSTAQSEVVPLIANISETIIVLLFGSLIIATYHPYYLLYSVIIVIIAFCIVATFYPRLLTQKSQLSDLKYEITERLMRTVDISKAEATAHSQADTNYFLRLSEGYLLLRKEYFRIVLSKTVLIGLLIPFAQALFVLISGKLFFAGTLSIGQFVAAEMILTYILASLRDLVKNLEKIVKVVVSFDKLDSVTNSDREVPRYEII